MPATERGALRKEWWVVALLFAAGFAVRLKLALTGGIWADEGLVINILAIPSLGEMIDFLRFHESHPPLFYLLLRAWQGIAGSGEAGMLWLVSFIGALIVPVAYATASRLFSARVGLLSAGLVSVSPSLVEHSAQIRPYGLLPILALLSCFFLIGGIRHGGVVRWTLYSVFTVLLLYTHNWTWLVFGGEIVAGIVAIIRYSAVERRRRSIEFALALAAAVVLYLPWMTSLVFQVVHAGHTAPPLNSVFDRIAYVVLGIASIPYLVLLAMHPQEKAGLVLVAAIGTVLFLLTLRVLPRAGDLLNRLFQRNGAGSSSASLGILLLVPAATLGAAFVMSPRSNLILERCIAMLAPLILLAIAFGVDRLASSRNASLRPLGYAAVVFLFLVSIASDVALVPTTRSNAREAGKAVAAAVRPDDLVIVAPEWYAPSFNYYFPPVVEQIDYPNPGRSGLLDFADVRTKALDTTATIRLMDTIAGARESGRRVWLVTARRYLRYVDEELPKLTTEQQRSRYTSVLRVKEARDALVRAYGAPDTSNFVKGALPRYEEIIPMLFVPAASGESAQN